MIEPFTGVPRLRPAALPSRPVRMVGGKFVRVSTSTGDGVVRVDALSNGVTVYRAGGLA